MTVCSSGLFSMATDSSGEESVFTGCASSGVERGQGGVRRRQVSVPELMKRAAARKSKWSAPGRGSRSSPDAAAPAAKRPAAPARPSATVDQGPKTIGWTKFYTKNIPTFTVVSSIYNNFPYNTEGTVLLNKYNEILNININLFKVNLSNKQSAV